MTNIEINYYKPQKIFTEDSKMTGSNNFYLAEAFYNTRYSNCNLHEVEVVDNFYHNAGAIQLFNLNNNLNHKPLYCISIPMPTSRDTYGHSEKILIRKALDEYISNNNGEIEPPSSNLNVRTISNQAATYIFSSVIF